MADVSIKYALLNDKKTVIHIKDAKKGDPHLKYYCDECGGELNVRDGPINKKHFAHRPGENLHCATRKHGNGESTIHKYWKQHFSNVKSLTFPFKYLTSDMEVKEEFITREIVKS